MSILSSTATKTSPPIADFTSFGFRRFIVFCTIKSVRIAVFRAFPLRFSLCKDIIC